MIGASFDSTKTPLQDLLTHADRGSLQLPDYDEGPEEWDADEPLEEAAP